MCSTVKAYAETESTRVETVVKLQKTKAEAVARGTQLINEPTRPEPSSHSHVHIDDRRNRPYLEQRCVDQDLLSHSGQQEEEEEVKDEDACPDLDEQHFATDIEWEMNRPEGLLWRANHETEIPQIA